MAADKSPSAPELAQALAYSLAYYLGSTSELDTYKTEFFGNFPDLIESFKLGAKLGINDSFFQPLSEAFNVKIKPNSEALIEYYLEKFDTALATQEISPENYLKLIGELVDCNCEDKAKIYTHILNSPATQEYKPVVAAAHDILVGLIDDPQSQTVQNLQQNGIVGKTSKEIENFASSISREDSRKLICPQVPSFPGQTAPNVDPPSVRRDRVEQLAQNIEGYTAFFASKIKSDAPAELNDSYAYGYCLISQYAAGMLSHEDLSAEFTEVQNHKNCIFPLFCRGSYDAVTHFPQYKHLYYSLAELKDRAELFLSPSQENSDSLVVSAMNAYYSNVVPVSVVWERVEEACGGDRQFATRAYRRAQRMAKGRNDEALQNRFFLCEMREKVRADRQGDITDSYKTLIGDYTRKVIIAQMEGDISDWEARHFIQEAFQDGRGVSRARTSMTLGKISNIAMPPRYVGQIEPIQQEASANLSKLESMPDARSFVDCHYGPMDFSDHLSRIVCDILEISQSKGTSSLS